MNKPAYAAIQVRLEVQIPGAACFAVIVSLGRHGKHYMHEEYTYVCTATSLHFCMHVLLRKGYILHLLCTKKVKMRSHLQLDDLLCFGHKK